MHLFSVNYSYFLSGLLKPIAFFAEVLGELINFLISYKNDLIEKDLVRQNQVPYMV